MDETCYLVFLPSPEGPNTGFGWKDGVLRGPPHVERPKVDLHNPRLNTHSGTPFPPLVVRPGVPEPFPSTLLFPMAGRDKKFGAP